MHRRKDGIILSKFPKTRPPLPQRMEEIYKTFYKSNRGGLTKASFLTQRMESWLHKQVAKDLSTSRNLNLSTLELGAGTLNQLQYEPNMGPYDIVEPFTALYDNSPHIGRIRSIYSDISDVPVNHRYDRITSVATLEHICNLPDVLAKSGLLMADDGVFRASIPSEGTFLWALGWKLTTGLEFKLMYHQNYGSLMKHEHVNSAAEIEVLLKYFFKKIQTKVFGFSRSLSLYRYHECRHPRIDLCRKFTK